MYWHLTYHCSYEIILSVIAHSSVSTAPLTYSIFWCKNDINLCYIILQSTGTRCVFSIWAFVMLLTCWRQINQAVLNRKYITGNTVMGFNRSTRHFGERKFWLSPFDFFFPPEGLKSQRLGSEIRPEPVGLLCYSTRNTYSTNTTRQALLYNLQEVLYLLIVISQVKQPTHMNTHVSYSSACDL